MPLKIVWVIFGLDQTEVWFISTQKKSKPLNTYYVKPSENNQNMRNFYEDIQGQLWMACFQGGIFRLNRAGYMPGNYRTEDGLGNNSVWATLEAQDGKVWIGTHGGIDIYDPVEKSVKHLGMEQGLVNLRNTNLTEDVKGRIWAGGSESGMSIIDLNKETIQKLTADSGIEKLAVSSSLKNIDGTLWLSQSDGELENIDIEKGVYKRLIDKDSTIQKSSKERVIQTEKNIIWVVNYEFGLQKIDTENNTSLAIFNRKWPYFQLALFYSERS